MKIRFQQQSEHSECGLACATMLIDYWSEKVNLTEMRERYGVPNGGYNLAQIQLILRDADIDVKAVKSEAKSINAVPVPFIAFWKNKHFIIVEKVTHKHIVVVDPARGKRKFLIWSLKMVILTFVCTLQQKEQENINSLN
ncbi:hypothetical protein BN1423_2230024 [Carnobacterium maltaromaticum]|nr:hypothetical protein BN1423_2230024 [Carnobacterium maltaromaticum]